MKKHLVFVLGLVVLSSLFITRSASADDTGVRDAGTGTSVSGVGSVNWSNPSRITANDGLNATATLTPFSSSKYLEGTNYGFTIPTNATIDGIKVSIERKSSASTLGLSINDNVVKLIKGGSVVGGNKANSTDWLTSMSTASYGGTSDLWGSSWTPADINASNFGVALSASSEAILTDRTASVNYIQVTVYYTLSDTTAPVIASHSNITVEATSTSGATVTYTSPNATDNVDATAAATCTPASGSVFPIGTTTVTCNKTDTAGNVATPTTFTITVQDTTSPVVTVSSNITLEAGSGGEVIGTYSASATDTVSGSITPTCTPASGSVFPIGTTTVTCSATDTAGNTGTASFSVIVSDTTGPSLVLPSPIEEATSASGATVSYTVLAVDLVDGSLPVVCTPTSGSVFPIGTTTVTCTAEDLTGNITAGSFDIVVQDTTAPVITLLGDSPFTFMAHFAYEDAGATASDAVDGDLTASMIIVNSVDYMTPGTYTVTYDVVDAAGNHATQVVRDVVVTVRRRGHVPQTNNNTNNTNTEENTPDTSENSSETESGGAPVIETPVVETPAPEGEVLGVEKFIFTTWMKLGSKYGEVSELQKRLAAEGFYKGDIDGKFGKVLQQAVKDYQKANPPLKIDGIVGPKTRAVLNK